MSSPETPSQEPTKHAPSKVEGKPREWYDSVGDAYDYLSGKAREVWERIFGESKAKREKLKKEVETDRKKYVEKDGFRFELWDKKEDPAELQKDVQSIAEKVDKVYKNKVEGVVTAAKMVETSGYSAEEKADLKSYMQAESSRESAHSYRVLGSEIKSGNHKGTRALGRYQIMPKNWIVWSKEIFDGKAVVPTPQAQEYVAYKRFVKMYDSAKAAVSNGRPYAKYRKDVFYSMACVWYSGKFTEVNIPRFNWSIVLASSGDIDDYAQGVLREMGFKKDLMKKVGSRLKEKWEDAKEAVRH